MAAAASASHPASRTTMINLLYHAATTVSSALIPHLLNIPSLSLNGLHTYIHPDNLSSSDSLRAAIRRPSDDPTANLRPRSKSKSKSSSSGAFDESKVQLFRLRLADSHLPTRIFFPSFRNAFILSSVALSNLALHLFLLPVSPFAAYAPSLLALAYLLFSLVSTARSSSSSRTQLSSLSAFLSFIFALFLLTSLSPRFFDFHVPLRSFNAVPLAAISALLAGSLLSPSLKSARSFWIGTDQLRWNLSVLSCGPYNRFLLYVAVLSLLLSPFLWFNPVADAPPLAPFKNHRIGVLATAAAAQILALRATVQMYLNEAVLCWYERLHSSRAPDLSYGRAKVFLHNHYLCLSVAQFFGPPMMVLILLGISQIRGNLFDAVEFANVLADWSDFVKDLAVFLAWWIVFVSGVFVTCTLALFRIGFLYIS